LAALQNVVSEIGAKNSQQRPAALALVRLSLGIAQMWMAIATFILLIRIGIQKGTLVMAGITTALTILSRFLFRKQREDERKKGKQGS